VGGLKFNHLHLRIYVVTQGDFRWRQASYAAALQLGGRLRCLDLGACGASVLKPPPIKITGNAYVVREAGAELLSCWGPEI